MRFRAAFTTLVLLAIAMDESAASAEQPVPVNHEYHVSVNGDDANDGSMARPLRSISAAARLAHPGDAITVHEGVYRECISPPRGGESDARRIVYQAAAGETVEIKGSEVVTGWERIERDIWTVTVPNTLFGEYNPYRELIHGDWFNPLGRQHHTGAVYLNGEWLMEAASLYDIMKPVTATPRWFGEAGDTETTLWAQFKGIDPNKELVEINVRRAVFYPDKPGMNYITVRGFIMRHAATQWAPPTAEQIGLIGTHWSKGWIIENNVISHSKCVGIALGKYGDQWDNTSEDTAEGYVLTIQRATENGWSRDSIGNHIVRNNTISHCEQAGIVGSLGAVFSKITGNTIHDIHVQCLFTGAEMAGIKIHAAIDTTIGGNHIFRTVRGIWLDWMNQGARVTGNLLHENASEDLFVEVNHGPFLVDNNLFLSERSLLDMSEGGAYVHNLMTGKVMPRPELSRETPFHKAHSTEVAGLRNIEGGDNRFFNNIFAGDSGLAEYDATTLSVWMSGNVFLHGATPSKHEQDALVLTNVDPGIKLAEDSGEVVLHITSDAAWGTERKRELVTSELLGRAKIPDLPYVHADDTPIRIDMDYFGKIRSESIPFPGPFELPNGGEHTLKVWPVGEATRAGKAP
ncbi:MAG: right-handed parallel beta-helix repeat-containing protein [Candidatus Hydrogenedentes bacterium]|nr:right-handed parallel beta-helix repeat-containing protein [Candidatus Hydrogenedentota bacterium]